MTDITNNTIHNTSTGSKDIGIQALRISDGLTITGNTIQGGYRGIEVQSCAGYYKQNALTTLITTSRVQQVPVNQASNYFRHPSFEG